MLAAADWQAMRVTAQLCLATTLILLLVGTPIAWWLAHTRSRFRALIEALVALPLVLPPTVLGFYLLLALGPNGPIGRAMQALGGQHLAFTFSGILIGSLLYSLPFAVQPLQDGFRALGRGSLEVAATLGAGPVDRWFSVVLPQVRGSVLTAATLTFAHTLGEFGVVLMIGGNLSGDTRVLSIAIFDAAEAMDYPRAHLLSGLMLLSAFALLWMVYRWRGHVLGALR